MWYRYKNLSRKSSVVCYQINSSSIEIMFSDNAYYVYPVQNLGITHFEEMKKYAIRGEYLNRFIGRYVSNRYSYKDKRPFPPLIN